MNIIRTFYPDRTYIYENRYFEALLVCSLSVSRRRKCRELALGVAAYNCFLSTPAHVFEETNDSVCVKFEIRRSEHFELGTGGCVIKKNARGKRQFYNWLYDVTDLTITAVLVDNCISICGRKRGAGCVWGRPFSSDAYCRVSLPQKLCIVRTMSVMTAPPNGWEVVDLVVCEISPACRIYIFLVRNTENAGVNIPLTNPTTSTFEDIEKEMRRMGIFHWYFDSPYQSKIQRYCHLVVTGSTGNIIRVDDRIQPTEVLCASLEVQEWARSYNYGFSDEEDPW
tara:strand:- start:812 stop:1657 length:846 start_codon:yes stop_codon:yes gene_type:complete